MKLVQFLFLMSLILHGSIALTQSIPTKDDPTPHPSKPVVSVGLNYSQGLASSVPVQASDRLGLRVSFSTPIGNSTSLGSLDFGISGMFQRIGGRLVFGKECELFPNLPHCPTCVTGLSCPDIVDIRLDRTPVWVITPVFSWTLPINSESFRLSAFAGAGILYHGGGTYQLGDSSNLVLGTQYLSGELAVSQTFSPVLSFGARADLRLSSRIRAYLEVRGDRWYQQDHTVSNAQHNQTETSFSTIVPGEVTQLFNPSLGLILSL